MRTKIKQLVKNRKTKKNKKNQNEIQKKTTTKVTVIKKYVED